MFSPVLYIRAQITKLIIEPIIEPISLKLANTKPVFIIKKAKNFKEKLQACKHLDKYLKYMHPLSQCQINHYPLHQSPQKRNYFLHVHC